MQIYSISILTLPHVTYPSSSLSSKNIRICGLIKQFKISKKTINIHKKTKNYLLISVTCTLILFHKTIKQSHSFYLLLIVQIMVDSRLIKIDRLYS